MINYIHNAVDYALLKHAGQTYGDQQHSMFVHLADVAMTVAQYGGTVDEIVGGYLHDVVEDTDATLDELRAEGFTDLQVRIVDLCTDPAGLATRAERKAIVNERFRREGFYGARLVKCADRLKNQGYSIATNNHKMMGRYCIEFPQFDACVAAPILEYAHGGHLYHDLQVQYETMKRRLA